MTAVNKVDSNSTGLRFAEEQRIGVLPDTGVIWWPAEPNSYNDFGGQITKTARRPINANRQLRKGVTTDLDASGGYNTDLTQTNLQDLLQGFFFASLRRKGESAFSSVPVVAVDGSGKTITLSNLQATAAAVGTAGTGYVAGEVLGIDGTGATSTTATTLTVVTVGGSGEITSLAVNEPGRYSVDPDDLTGNALTGGSGSGAEADLTYTPVVGYVEGMLVFANGFDDAANNGLKTVNTVDGTGVTLTVDETMVTDASPDTGADLVIAGFIGGVGEFDISSAGSLPTLTNGATNLTTLGLIPGEWIFIGGDSAGTNFTTAGVNRGFARIKSVETGVITLDKTQNTFVTEADTTQTVQIFFGRVLKNENDPTLIRRRTYCLERTLGAPDDESTDLQAEYLDGSVPNEITFNFGTSDKITADLGFVSTDHQLAEAGNLRSGARPDIEDADAYNTSTNFSRLKLAILESANANPNALFGYLEEFSIVIGNGITPNKAISVLGAFDASAGAFSVGGSMTAYFSTVTAVAAVRNNADVTLDFALVENNAGVVVDIPLIALDNGRLDVAQDEPIKLPLGIPAAEDRVFHHTLLMTFFDYLPSVAEE